MTGNDFRTRTERDCAIFLQERSQPGRRAESTLELLAPVAAIAVLVLTLALWNAIG